MIKKKDKNINYFETVTGIGKSITKDSGDIGIYKITFLAIPSVSFTSRW